MLSVPVDRGVGEYFGKFDRGVDGTQCVCSPSFFIAPNHPCIKCPVKESICNDVGLHAPGMKNGLWRSDPTSPNLTNVPFHTCPYPKACLGSSGNKTSNSMTCVVGHQGVLCAVCSPNYIFQNNQCVFCPNAANASVGALFGTIAVMVIMIFIAYLLYLQSSALTEEEEIRIVQLIQSETANLIFEKMINHQKEAAAAAASTLNINDDHDNDESTSESEIGINSFAIVLTNLRASISKVQIGQLFRKIDANNNSTISLEEIEDYVNNFRGIAETAGEALSAKDNLIQISEILKVVTKLIQNALPSNTAKINLIRQVKSTIKRSNLPNKTALAQSSSDLLQNSDLTNKVVVIQNVEEYFKNVMSTPLTLNNSQIEHHSMMFGSVLMKIKLFVGFAQCLSYFPVTFDSIPWTEDLKRLMLFFEIFSFDFLSFLGDVGCVLQTPFLTKFNFHMALPPSLMLLLLLAYAVSLRMTKCSKKFTVQSVSTAFYTLVSLTQFSLYIGVATRIFRLFKCHEIEGKWYLMADYSVVCFESSWNSTAVLAYVCMVVFVVGIPAVQFFILWRNRKYISEDDCVSDEDYARHLEIKAKYGSLFDAYVSSCYYYDFIDLLRRLILTGGLILIGNSEAVAQIFLGILICSLWLFLILYTKPYKSMLDTVLSGILSFTLLLTLNSGVCMRLYELTLPSANLYERNAFSVVLITVIVICILLSVLSIIVSIKQLSTAKIFAKKSKNNESNELNAKKGGEEDMNGFDNEEKTPTGTIESQVVEMTAIPVFSRKSRCTKIEPNASKI